MNSRTVTGQNWRYALLTLTMVTAGAVDAPQARGGLVDFVFNGPAPPPMEACYPTTPVYQAMDSSCCESGVQFQSPDAMCCPPTMVQPQPSSGWRWPSCLSQGNTCSEPAYRTTWKTVPVTSYRPVTTTDHATGCPVTVMKPCTTYAWQADRRPCGIFERLFGLCDTAQPCPSECTTMPTDCMEGTVMSSDWGSTSVMGEPTPAVPTPATSPYYSPSPPSVLTTPTPASPPPPAASQPPSLTQPPSGSFPGYAPAPPSNSPVPAPTAPPAARARLQRPTLQPMEPTPAISEPSPQTTTEPTAIERQSMVQLPWTSEASSETPNSSGENADGPSLGFPLTVPGETLTSPVPSPDAKPRRPAESQPAPAPPQPRDQVASWRGEQAVRYASTACPAEGRVVPQRSATVSAKRDIRNWDESGWRSAAK